MFFSPVKLPPLPGAVPTLPVISGRRRASRNTLNKVVALLLLALTACLIVTVWALDVSARSVSNGVSTVYGHIRYQLRIHYPISAQELQQIHEDYEAFKAFVKTLPPPQSQLQQGILFPAGGTDMMANALAIIRVLRSVHGCQLPVEISYHGKAEASPVMQTALEVHNLALWECTAWCGLHGKCARQHLDAAYGA